MAEERKNGIQWLQGLFMENFGLSRAMALVSSLLILFILVGALAWFFYSAPPSIITMTSGPPGSSFETNAYRYRDILARSGVTLKILNSQGSQENLARLENAGPRVDVGFVQSGLSNVVNNVKTNTLISLGSVAYQPLLVFYRGPTRALLSDFKGEKLDIGASGSGVRSLALTLLGLNGLVTNTVFPVDVDPARAPRALREGTVDALFLMGDSASPQVMRDLLHDTNIQLFDFTQADAYTRRVTYLNKLNLPEGGIDFGKNIPSRDVALIGPTVELLAREDLHPALSDLLLEAAREVHGSASLMRRQGEFPAPMEHDFPLSSDAQRFYKSGKSFTYRYLPFRLASPVNRLAVVFVPVFVVLVPGMRLIPALLRLRMRIRLFRWYRALLALERDLAAAPDSVHRNDLAPRLDQIDEAVNKMKVPASFADQFYVLRQNIVFVRARLPKKV